MRCNRRMSNVTNQVKRIIKGGKEDRRILDFHRGIGDAGSKASLEFLRFWFGRFESFNEKNISHR